MQYKKWNDAFLNHFFKDNENEEIILYIDEEIINTIGEENDLGDIDDFLKVTIVDLEERRNIFTKNISRPPSDTVFNRNIRSGTIFDYAAFLSKQRRPSTVLPFLNYVLLSIYAKTDLEEKDTSYYKNLNSIIKQIDNAQRTVSSTNINLDVLFECIKSYDSRFKNEQIGKLAFMGLLKYQVVLNLRETKELYDILYFNHIKLSEEATFLEVINKLLLFIPKNSTLRTKVIQAKEDRAIATFLLNQVKIFNHENYTPTDTSLKPYEKADFAFAFKLDGENSLMLLTNLSQTSPDNRENKFKPYIDKTFNISIDYNRIQNSYSPNPIEVNETINFNKEYRLETDNFTIKTLNHDNVNFFQKTGYGYFLQTKIPKPNTDTFIVVKKDKKEITKFEKWIENPKNATNISDQIYNDSSKQLFGEEWVLYAGNGKGESIEKPYYSKEDEVTKLSFKGNDLDLDVIIVSGFKVSGLQNTYLDIALPSFLIDFPDFNSKKLKLKISETSKGVKVFKEIDYLISENNVLKLFYTDNDYHIENDHYQLTFEYINKGNVFEKSFEFSVIASSMVPLEESQYFKLNEWGEKSTDSSNYYNGIQLVSSSKKVELNPAYKNKLYGLSDQFDLEAEFFINILAGTFHRQQNQAISRASFNKTIDYVIKHYEVLNTPLEYDQFSISNLIRNLIALSFINKNDVRENSTESFQLNPPTFIKIERTFPDKNEQVYKLVGARTKFFTQKLLLYCDDNSHCVKFKNIVKDDNNKLEIKLLPRHIFIEGIKLDHFKKWIAQEKLESFIFFEREEKHHIGDSLLNFLASVEDFEKQEINDASTIRITDQSIYTIPERENFPRIRESVQATGYPPTKSKHLEVEKDLIIKSKLKHWMEFYVRYKHEEVVMLMERPRDKNGRPCFKDEDIYTLDSILYFYKYRRLPSLVYKALVSLNHNLPTYEKLFIINSPLPKKDREYAFNEFKRFNLTKSERKKEVSKIITGNRSILGNPQLGITERDEINYRMYHHSGLKIHSDFDQFITITDQTDKLIAITTLKNKVYVASDYIDKNSSSTITINYINSKNENSIENFEMVELLIEENINTILSSIFNENKSSLKIKETTFNKNLFYTKKEEITIKRHTTHGLPI